ncbi:MAG: hypothetical protein AAF928_15985 [Myxococcota bacterium]
MRAYIPVLFVFGWFGCTAIVESRIEPEDDERATSTGGGIDTGAGAGGGASGPGAGGAGGTVLSPECVDDGGCPSWAFCAEDGTCTPRLPANAPCSRDRECVSRDCQGTCRPASSGGDDDD